MRKVCNVLVRILYAVLFIHYWDGPGHCLPVRYISGQDSGLWVHCFVF